MTRKQINVLQKEEKIMDYLSDAWNTFLDLQQTHPDDIEDFKNAIHDAQKIIALRVARRASPDMFYSTKNG